MIFDIKTAPEWLTLLLPKSLISAFNDEIHEPKTAGRKQALENDNVNDFIYYARKKKFLSSQNQFYASLQFSNTSPFEYTKANKKFKCQAYLAAYDSTLASQLYDPFLNNDAPDWYNYFYLFLKGITDINIDTVYNLFMTNPKPIECLDYLLQSYPDKLIARHTVNKEIDLAFFNSLSADEDKLKILKLISQKQIFLDVHQHVLELCNCEYITALLGLKNLFEYATNNSNIIDRVKEYIDSHPELFENLKNCQIVIPKFKDFYEYAYMKTTYADINEEHLKEVENHIIFLAKNKNIEEIKYIIGKGWKWSDQSAWNAFDSSPECRELIELMDQQQQLYIVDYALNHDFKYCFGILKGLGYRPSVSGIANEFAKEEIQQNVSDFEIINLIPENTYLDELKPSIAVHHPELIPEFVSRFHNRFRSNDLDSWELENSFDADNYGLACKNLKIDGKVYIKKVFKKCRAFFSGKPELYRCRRDMIMYCLKYPVIKGKPKYLDMAMEHNDIEMVKLLISKGANPYDIPNWKNHCSNNMYIAIMSLI